MGEEKRRAEKLENGEWLGNGEEKRGEQSGMEGMGVRQPLTDGCSIQRTMEEVCDATLTGPDRILVLRDESTRLETAPLNVNVDRVTKPRENMSGFTIKAYPELDKSTAHRCCFLFNFVIFSFTFANGWIVFDCFRYTTQAIGSYPHGCAQTCIEIQVYFHTNHTNAMRRVYILYVRMCSASPVWISANAYLS